MPWKSSFTSSASSSERPPRGGSPHADWRLQGDREPRVDRQHLARDVGGGIGGQEDRGAHELVGTAEAPKGDAARQLGDARLSEERSVPLGLEEPGRDRVRGDALVAELDPEGAHQRLEPTLRRTVRRIALERLRSHHRADEDEPPLTAYHHVPSADTGERILRYQICFDQPAKVLGRDVL